MRTTKGNLKKKTAAIVMSALIMANGAPAVSFAAEQETMPSSETTTTSVMEEQGSFAFDEHARTINIYTRYVRVPLHGVDGKAPSYEQIQWESSDEDIVMVTENGFIYGLKTGSAVISGTYNGHTEECVFTVSDAPVPITGIHMEKQEQTVEVGETFCAYWFAEPQDYNEKIDQPVYRTISSDCVVKDPDGRSEMYYAVKPGKAVITVQYKEFTASCEITVKEKENGQSGQKTEDPVSAATGEKTGASGEQKPTQTETQKPAQTGEQKPAQTGEQKPADPVKQDTSVKKVPLKTLSISKKTATLKKGKTLKLTTSYAPANTTVSKKVTWTSSNKKVATVSKSGVVTAKKAGKATITARMGGKNVTCKVTVAVPLKSISLDCSKVTMEKGKTCRLHVIKYAPSNTTASKKVTWHSSNKKVATVDKTGKITARKTGTVTITAKCGGKKDTCIIKVVKANKHYKSAAKAYTYLNQVRATKGAGYLNPDNKTCTVFNTNSKNKLPQLRRDAELEYTARVRARELSKLFDHKRPNGKSCFTAYPNSLDTYGENIFMGSKDPGLMMAVFAESRNPYSGQGHRRNILSPKYNAVGIACYEHHGQYYWVQCFGHK